MTSKTTAPVADWDHMVLDRHFAEHTVGDLESANTPRQVHGAMHSPVEPTRVASPSVIATSSPLAQSLDIDPALLSDPRAAGFLSGNELLPKSAPFAAAYGGHQFGHWAGQLGDGRAISLGEWRRHDGDRFELQLKGAGPTPYSRSADGRAVLRSSVREFLMSEAMHHLNVPTTRALSLVLTGDDVMRDMLYDGNAAYEPGAIVCRVAPSFLRFGNFQLFASRNETTLLEELVDYAIRTHFPAIADATAPNSPKRVLAWLEEVTKRTAVMVSEWMRVGFVHGVMNTDNMSVLGLTIDYGPYGWLDAFDPTWTPNTTDNQHRRYRFGQQPQIALWNLARFAEALLPLVGNDRSASEALEESLGVYASTYEAKQDRMWREKFGLVDDAPVALIEEGVALLVEHEVDMTIFFRNLALVDVTTAIAPTDANRMQPLFDAFYAPVTTEARTALAQWLTALGKRVQSEGHSADARSASMNLANPKYVLRNYLAQLAIDDATKGDYASLHRLQRVLERPYAEQPEAEDLFAKRPEWAKNKVGCSMLSCSS